MVMGDGGAGLPPPATGLLGSCVSKQNDLLSLSWVVPLAGSSSCAVLKNALYTSVLGTMQNAPCIYQLGSLGHKMASAGCGNIRIAAFPLRAVAKLFVQASSCASDTGWWVNTRRLLAEPSAELYNSSKMQERQSDASSLFPLSSSIESQQRDGSCSHVKTTSQSTPALQRSR